MDNTSDYIFSRDHIDDNRINLGHYQWKELFGYLLHPSIPGTSGLRIADVATGTATWLMDLSTQLPDAQLDGLDITLKATPPSGWVPANVSLREWNIRDPVPEDLVEAYDIVHVRYLCLVLSDQEILSVLQNITKLLKPGGYLQWGEIDTPSWRIEKSGPDSKADALQRLYDLEASQDVRLRPTWVSLLPSMFKQAGLGDVQSDIRDPPGHMAWQMHQCMLLMHEIVAQTTGNTAIALALKELLPEVIAEGKTGAAWVFTRWVVVGRKPAKA